MPESAEEIYARALAAADADGRLAMPPVEEWETFPFDGDLRARPLLPPCRRSLRGKGAGGVDCWRCETGIDDAIWCDERWLVGSLQKPSGLPVVVILYPRAHHDLGDLPPQLAAELGPMIHARRGCRALGRRDRPRPRLPLG